MTYPWHPDLAVQVATFGVSVSPGVPLGLVPEEDVGGEEGDGAVVGGHHLQQDPLDWGPMNRSSLPAVPLMRQFYATLSGASLKQQVVVLTLLGWLTDTGGNSGGILPSAQPVSTFSDHSHKVLMPKQ